MNIRLFKATGDTVNIDVAASSARVALGTPGPAVEIMNNGTATAWITFGGSGVTAAVATSRPIGPGVTLVSAIPVDATHVAAIAAGATGKIYFTPGTGA